MSFTNRRDVVVAIAARAAGLLGDEAAAVALVLRAQHDGQGTTAVAGLLIAAMAPIVLLAPLAGRLVDRHDSRHLLVIAALGQAVACAALLAVSAPLWAVLALVMAVGAGQAVTGTTWQSLLPSMAGPEDTARAVGLGQSCFALAGIVAPALGGALYTVGGARLPLLIDVVSFLLVALGAALVRTRRVGGRSSADPRGDEQPVSGGGLRIVWTRPVLRALLSMLAVFITLGAMVNVVEVFLVVDTLHANGAWFGAVAGAWSAGMVLASWWAGRVVAERRPLLIVVAATTLALALIGYSTVPAVAWLLPLAVVGGLGNGALNVAISAQVYAATPPAALGRVLATVGATANTAQIASYALGGVLAAAVSPRTIFALGGVLSVLALVALARPVLRPAPAASSAVPSRVEA